MRGLPALLWDGSVLDAGMLSTYNMVGLLTFRL